MKRARGQRLGEDGAAGTQLPAGCPASVTSRFLHLIAPLPQHAGDGWLCPPSSQGGGRAPRNQESKLLGSVLGAWAVPTERRFREGRGLARGHTASESPGGRSPAARPALLHEAGSFVLGEGVPAPPHTHQTHLSSEIAQLPSRPSSPRLRESRERQERSLDT